MEVRSRTALQTPLGPLRYVRLGPLALTAVLPLVSILGTTDSHVGRSPGGALPVRLPPCTAHVLRIGTSSLLSVSTSRLVLVVDLSRSKVGLFELISYSNYKLRLGQIKEV